ncbi:hypothetical protein DSECCO2_434840 [anaerobic digester metagenome]
MLLALPDLPFGLLALGDVAADADDTGAVADRRPGHADLHVEHRAVLAAMPGLESVLDDGKVAENLPDLGFPENRLVIPGEEVRHLVHGVAEHLGETPVGLDDAVIPADDDDAVAAAVHEHGAHGLARFAFPFLPHQLRLVVRLLRQGVGDDEKCIGHLPEALLGHERDLRQGPAVLVRVGADDPGIVEHAGVVLKGGAHLAHEPVGHVHPVHGDAHPGVPQAAAQATPHDGSAGVVDSEQGVGAHAVGAPRSGGADDVAAQAGEVARPGQGDPGGRGHDGRHARGRGEAVLNPLDLVQVEKVLKADLADRPSARMSQHDAPSSRIVHCPPGWTAQARARTSSRAPTGLEMYPSMPAARHMSRSPLMA